MDLLIKTNEKLTSLTIHPKELKLLIKYALSWAEISNNVDTNRDVMDLTIILNKYLENA